MVQNYQTLKDYLEGFVTFKQLLQLDDDDEDEDEEEQKNIGKITKKTIKFNKIVVNYGDEVAVVRKLLAG